MTPEKIAELEAATAAAKSAAEAAGGTDEALNEALHNAESALSQAKAPSQTDLVKQELERSQRQGRTEAEKAAYSLKKNAERAKELGIDPAQVLGFGQESTVVDKTAPMTIEMYEQIQKDNAQKSALQLADNITDEYERELTKHYLSTRIVLSGDPTADLKLAQGMVNAVKNAQVLEETARARHATTHSSGPGAPAKKVGTDEAELTTAEKQMLNFKGSDGKQLLTKEEIIATRPKP